MPRARKGAARTKAHKKILKQARGYVGGRSRLYRTAKESILRAQAYAYRDRRTRKRDFRRLWITRISAAVRQRGMTYSRFINGLTSANVEINRKILADLAVNDEATFNELVEIAKSHAVA